MTRSATVNDLIDYRHSAAIGGQAIGFLDSRGLTGVVARADLFHSALAAATALAHHGLRQGDRVVLVIPTGQDYLVTLVGCLLAGIVPCTVAPPRSPADSDSAGVKHLHAAIGVVAPAAVIADPQCRPALPPGLRALTVDALHGHAAIRPGRLPDPDPEALHHIQLTSGSTSAPKAVALTYRNVTANLAALAAATQVDAGRDRLSTWLPLYHDMGLVQVLLSLVSGAGLDLMPPMGFLRDPMSWLGHIAARGGTITAAPPFAYRTAADRYRARPAPLDLSGLRQTYVGAEPVPAAVLRHFRDTFTGSGLNDEVIIPCYGMAETVLATTLALDTGPSEHHQFGRVRTQRFDRAALDERQLAVPEQAGQPSRTLVACGRPVSGIALRVTDTDGRDVPAGQVGSIKVRGDSVMAGYLTANRIDAPTDGWHDTGDLGLESESDLYVVGRSKEMLIVRGRNMPPYDVEAVIEQHTDIGAGNAAVFSIPSDDAATEPVIAVVETRQRGNAREDLRADVTTAVRQVFGLSLADVVVLPRGGIPRTSSGKRQRATLRAAYQVDNRD
jgi:acyl-CoA synthetase (AMP-forming)/AMP-acid ligase II